MSRLIGVHDVCSGESSLIDEVPETIEPFKNGRQWRDVGLVRARHDLSAREHLALEPQTAPVVAQLQFLDTRVVRKGSVSHDIFRRSPHRVVVVDDGGDAAHETLNAARGGGTEHDVRDQFL